ncbi:unnamed protein product [Lepidochelys kempii]
MVKWTDAAEKAFMDLQTVLCSNPVLIAPDFNKEFILQTDASEEGLGAVLSQMVGDEEHSILYLSRKLLPREQKYAMVERVPSCEMGHGNTMLLPSGTTVYPCDRPCTPPVDAAK